ncbi:MAG: hypothetical protein ACU0DM_12080 [Paracoccus sp. (in: a-proteobacteria)]
MKYAAQTADGSWTGALYDERTDRAVAHHADFGESLVPVTALTLQPGVENVVLSAPVNDIDPGATGVARPTGTMIAYEVIQ